MKFFRSQARPARTCQSVTPAILSPVSDGRSKNTGGRTAGATKPRRRSLVLLLLCAIALHAQLGQWVQNLGSETGLRAVFFRPMSLPSGTIDGRRPPSETRAELARRIAAAPKDAALYRLRASEDELALDFPAAESDWKTYAELSGDRIPLADFYHRRLRPADELATLDTVATPEAFERAIAEAEAQGLPVVPQYRAWIAHDSANADLRKRFFHYLTDHGQYAAADAELQAYRHAFPNDESTWLEEVALALRRGTAQQAIAVFDKSFQPVMPAEWLKEYFGMLKGQGRLSEFVAQARAAVGAHPESLDPVARLFHYYENEQNHAAARRVLAEYQARKKTWTADELYATAQLFERVQEWDQAARQYYALYSLPSATDLSRERGLAGLAGVLLTAPEQPIRFGAGDLSLYKDIATMDPHPGFLNGILSLVLNSSSPRGKYEEVNVSSAAYFHRARATQLLDLFDAQFPKAPESPTLRAHLIEAYAGYGEDDGVIRAGRAFLAAYLHTSERTRVALLMADAFVRQEKVAEEFAIYDQLLKETQPAEHAQVLDRYIARLVTLRRAPDALAIYRREIGRNPHDAALYEKLAAFLDQHNLGSDVETVYKNAAAQFRGTSWDQKLARWYLSRKRTRDFADLTNRVAQIFSGTELEEYFLQVAHPGAIDPELYLQVNLYAHKRFPDNLTFVRNLLLAYTRKETANSANYTQLLHAYWFYDGRMRNWLFEALASTGKLDAELAAARNANAHANPAAAQFLAEGEAWRSHFESAAPLMRALAADFPGSSDVVLRASTVERSLGHTEAAVALARNLAQADPRDREALARVGDTLADRDLFTRARPYWNRMPQTEPGKPESYLEAATVFWDYYKYDDALRLIGEARTHLRQPGIYAYEAGANYEGKRDYPAAVKEYLRGSDQAQARLIALAQTRAHRADVDAGTVRAPLQVRAAVLEAEKRLDELQAILQAGAASARSATDLEFIQSTAASHGFVATEQLALERQVAVNRDPLERIRLRLALMRLQEARSLLPAARGTIEALYRENPAILGVVRATTDFYWRHQLADQAIATLTAAAAASNAEYRGEFSYEAARKATEAGKFAQARQLLEPLLAAQPFNSQYLAAMADTYARAGDDRGLRDFYRAAIDSMKQAPLSAVERNERVAGLRRGLIPALDRLGQHWDAMDQYIQLVNRYPEDQALIREAARFAAHNNLAPRLVAYYTKACSDSPKDYRWPMVLGRLHTHLENFDAAIAAYTAATVVRPDRIDLYLNRASLEERLLRFAQAERTYGTVWELSYRNPTWLEKIAELQARQSKSADAVATLREAYLAGRPERADTLLQMAGLLESWGLIQQAGDFAARAAQLGLEHENTTVYARVLTRLRRHEEVLSRLHDDESALQAMAQAVNEYYTPEEKAAFETALEKQAGPNPDLRWNAVAHTAEIYDLEARWMAAQFSHSPYINNQLFELQSRRMRFEEVGRQLEAMARQQTRGADESNMALSQAANAYAMIGDAEGLNRVFALMPEAQRPYAQQYWRTIARDDPWKLLPFAGHRNDAVDLAIESGDVKLALSAVAERGRSLPPVWTKAYTALTSLYYWSSAPDAGGVFQNMLGTATIGERLGKRVDRNQQLAGSVWFYYGSRFGEYLALKGQPQAEDYLPAALEADPANGAAYSDLADWYGERGDTRRAFIEYEHALELDPSRGAPHDRMALLLWDLGRHDEAIAQWKSALAAFEAQQGRPNLQEDFWVNAPAALEHVGERKLVAELGASVDSLLRAYVARHGGYRSQALIANAAKYRLIDFSRQPMAVLEQLSNEKSLERPDRIAILRRMIYLAPNNQWQLRWWKAQLAGLLLDSGDLAGAQAELAELKADANAPRYEWVDLELRIAAKTGGLDAILDRFPSQELENAARNFESRREEAVADRILEFVYSRELDQGDFSASNFLGLAQIRLKHGDTAEALQLLRRMQLVADPPFDSLMPAAALLRRFEHPSDAAEFLKARVAAVPWDANARAQLRQGLSALATDSNAPYRVRLEAAKTGAGGGAGELALLARGHITAAEANHPYYYEARLAAALATPDARTRVRLLMDAVAIRPDEHAPMLPLFRAAYEAGQFEVAHQAIWHGAASTDIAVARQMASVRERFDEELGGEAELREAKKGQSAAMQQQLDREIADLDQRAKRRAQNAVRRPEVTAGLEQGRVVRPRIEK